MLTNLDNMLYYHYNKCTKYMINALKKTLNKLGLSKHETGVLLVLLQKENLKVQTIAKLAHLNRTTTYGVLQTLMKKGLVQSTDHFGTSEFQSIEPKLLLNYIDRKQEELNERKKEIKELLPELKRLQSKSDVFPRIQVFEGIEGIKQAYEDTLENNKEKQLLDFTGTDAVFKHMGKEWVDYYVKKRARLEIKCIDIAPDTEWAQKSKKRDDELFRITKLMPEKYLFNTEIAIYDEKVAIFSFSEDQPIALIIEDKNISHTMKTLFKYIESTLSKQN